MRYIIIAILLCSMVSCSTTYYSGTVKDNFNGEQFHYPGYAPVDKSLWQLLKWRFTRQSPEKPDNIDIKRSSKKIANQITDNITITYINHSSFLIQTQNTNIITDPIYSERASPVSFAGPKRIIEPAIQFQHLPKIDYVLISHNHYDHLDIDTIIKLDTAFKPKILAGLGVCNYLTEEKGLNIDCKELDWQDAVQDTSDIIFTFLPAKHWSARGIFDRNKTLWGAFAIETKQGNIYFAGDTGYGDHFKKASNQFKQFIIALLPIGAYEPRWFMQEHHMNPQEAVQAHIDLKAQLSIGMHYGTFELTDESYYQPTIDLEKAKMDKNISNFITLEFGESLIK